LTVVKTQGYNIVIIMVDDNSPFIAFLKELIQQRRFLPSQLAKEMGISHSTVSRWLQGKELPSTKSCRKLAEYSGIPLQKILSVSGHIPEIEESPADNWPEFRDYTEKKYPDLLDDDLITLIERLIEQRRGKTPRSRDS
jgi:transcriptional regulator with XRE-family HTH domain